MYAEVLTVAFEGIEAKPVTVQTMLAPGLPSFQIVGLGDKAVTESRERVRSALTAIGLGLPSKRITVNLAPADMPKEGTHYDLPIALGIMAAVRAISPDAIAPYVVIGELGLDGRIAQVPGALPTALAANALGKGILCPEHNGAEAAWASSEMPVLAAPTLVALTNHLTGLQELNRPLPKVKTASQTFPDLKDVRGQESAKRALEVAAAGGHHMLMIGPPGVGKSMLAHRLPALLPPLEPAEVLDVALVHSLAGALTDVGVTNHPPFRAPHHTISTAALLGGGTRPKPGEVALAHRGVLFLDEFPEFSIQALEALRQPLESGETVIARVHHRIRYPSSFQLIAAMNPCRCGQAWNPGHTCRLGPRCEQHYQARISGPLWDRIDIQICMPQPKVADLALPPATETSADVCARVTAARKVQRQRYASFGSDKAVNARCPASILAEVCALTREGERLLEHAASRGQFSMRAYHRTLRVARTLADLDSSRDIAVPHLAEAIGLQRIEEARLAA
jgi:magnesium chelatase family protein